MDSNIDEVINNEENLENQEVLTTDWFIGSIQPQYHGLYEYTKPCNNFWDFPRKPFGMIKWNGPETGWTNVNGGKIEFNPEVDFWRGMLKPQD